MTSDITLIQRSPVQQFAGFYIQSRGWPVVPLAPNSKAPVIDDWPRLVFTVDDFSPKDNIGLRSVKGIFVSDADAPEVVTMADAFLPPTGAVWGRFSKPRSKRVYRCTGLDKTLTFKDLCQPDQKGAMLLELRVNHQDVCPPSIHPDGEPFKWDGLLLDEAHVELGPLERAHRLLATAAMVARYYPPSGARHEWCLALAGFFRSLGITEKEANRILDHAGRSAGDAKRDDRLNEVRTTYEKSDDTPLTGVKVLRELTSKGFVSTLQKFWGTIGVNPQGFITNHDGKILTNSPKNIRLALEKLGVELSFDSFASKPLVKYSEKRTFLGDAKRNRLWLDIEEQFGFLPAQALFDVVLQDTAHRNPFHPVRNYLSSLKWDGVPRVDSWLITYGGAADNEYVRAVSSLVLIAAVRRVTQPGCKFDELLVLESGQGLLKSSALRALCPKAAWFSDDLPLHVEAKQIIERTGGKWIIEASDLAGKNKASIEHLKASLSRQIDGPVRMAYAHLPDEIPRQFIIVGTTNSHKYLKDSTGNRRFWPVRVEKFDVEGIFRDRDQLWAEAVHREATGESIRLRAELYSLAELQQDRRRLEDAWEAPLSALFESGQAYRITTEELFATLQVPIERRDERATERVTGIMESMGFEHKKARAFGNADGKTVKRWCREPQPTLGQEDENDG